MNHDEENKKKKPLIKFLSKRKRLVIDSEGLLEDDDSPKEAKEKGEIKLNLDTRIRLKRWDKATQIPNPNEEESSSDDKDPNNSKHANE